MEKFLAKYMTPEALAALKEAYLKDHEGETTLPEYIGKKRFDEVNQSKKAAETQVAELTKQLAEHEQASKKATETAVAEALKGAKAEHEKQMTALKHDHEVETAVLAAHGRNLTAIRALIDPTKPVADEIARIQKSDAYLFGNDGDLPGGTGKQGGGDPGSGPSDAEMKAMRAAVGI